MDIIQIVPRLPPEFCGVGDYARLLAGAMRVEGVNTRFLVADPQWQGEATIDGCPVEVLAARTPQAFRGALEQFSTSSVLLHYVGYGYDLHGCPQWMLEALGEWRAGHQERRLTTMFHELYASGPPWTRAFWSSNRQRQIAAGLAQISDHCRTNMKFIARRIGNITSRDKTDVEVAPVFSTVGEPVTTAPLATRQPQMAVFGSTGWRRRAYFEHREELILACERLQIKRVIDIGQPFEGEVELPVPCVRVGALPAAEVSQLLSESQAGFLTYPERFFGKSTIFAAYCAHGVLPVCSGLKQGNEDGIQSEVHFWHPSKTAQINSTVTQQIAQAAHSWYWDHRLETQAMQVKNLLADSSSASS